MVRDDWFVTSSLFPHPLLKSHVLRKATDPSFAFPLAQNRDGLGSNRNKSGMFTLTHSACIFSLLFLKLCLQRIPLSFRITGVIFLQHYFRKPGGMNLKNSLQKSVCLLKHKRTKRRYEYCCNPKHVQGYLTALNTWQQRLPEKEFWPKTWIKSAFMFHTVCIHLLQVNDDLFAISREKETFIFAWIENQKWYFFSGCVQTKTSPTYISDSGWIWSGPWSGLVGIPRAKITPGFQIPLQDSWRTQNTKPLYGSLYAFIDPFSLNGHHLCHLAVLLGARVEGVMAPNWSITLLLRFWHTTTQQDDIFCRLCSLLLWGDSCLPVVFPLFCLQLTPWRNHDVSTKTVY